jgi:hypothetical protein
LRTRNIRIKIYKTDCTLYFVKVSHAEGRTHKEMAEQCSENSNVTCEEGTDR